LSGITTVFSDIGGVLLTNGWDRASRKAFVDQFKLDWDDYEDRHLALTDPFDTGEITLDQYVDLTVFHRPWDFSREQVRQFMLSRSQPLPESLALVARLAESRKCFLAALNNESRELNQHRIDRFGLRRYFSAFFSSCYLGVKKPEEGIYRRALEISQRAPEECVFIDDRPMNVEAARRFGIRGVCFTNAPQLERDLRSLGIEF
jgi:putative hydrolase of the HAD superfamily